MWVDAILPKYLEFLAALEGQNMRLASFSLRTFDGDQFVPNGGSLAGVPFTMEYVVPQFVLGETIP